MKITALGECGALDLAGNEIFGIINVRSMRAMPNILFPAKSNAPHSLRAVIFMWTK